MEEYVRTSMYRFRDIRTNKGGSELWLVRRKWWAALVPGWLIDRFGVGEQIVLYAGQRHRAAMAAFVDAIGTANQALVDEEQARDDEAKARELVDKYKPVLGISEWIRLPRTESETLIPSVEPEFKKMKKAFQSGPSRGRLGSPPDATRTRYHAGPLPSFLGEGKEFDHEIAYDFERNAKSSQNQGQQGSKRQQKRRQNQNNQGD